MKLFSQWIIVTLLTVLFAGCAALDQDARINFLEGQMKDVLQKSAEWDVTSKDARTKIADFNAQLDTLRREIQNLAGNIEEMEAGKGPKVNPIFAQEGTVQEVRDLKERLQFLESRVTDLEKRLTMDASAVAIPLPSSGSAVISQVPPQTAPSVKPSPPPVKEVKKEPPAPEDQKKYNEAIQAVKEKQYEKAIRLFRGFIKSYPGHNLNDNAQYWIGESYYAQKKYEEAIIEFEEVIQQYPKGDKVPAALLKEGLAFHELNDNTPARQILKKLIDQFPDSEEAKLAQEKLKKI
jgi:tol-pal system protein YbgF